MNNKELAIKEFDTVIELYSKGEIREALNKINKLSLIYKDNAFLFNIRGACYAALGKPEKAIENYEKSISINPGNIDALFNIGNIFREKNQLQDAVKSFKKIIALDPDQPISHFNLGVTLQELGKIHDAIDHYEYAKKLNPHNVVSLINLGFAFQSLGQFNEAIDEYEEALIIDKDNPILFNNLGACLREIGKMKDAMNCFERSLKIDSSYTEAYYNLGFVHQDLGNIREAILNFEHAISISKHAMSYHNLSYLKNFKPSDSIVKQMHSLLSLGMLNKSEEIHICRALANVYEKSNLKDEFFKYLDKANKLQKIDLGYTLEKPTNEHACIKKIFKSKSIPIIDSNFKNDSRIKPIFIVGMPRSGTSLVEQIISSHNEVFGAGELSKLTKLISPVIKNYINKDISGITSPMMSFIRDEYFHMLENLNISEKRVTDKMPLNFQYIGFILSAIPEAKIIHLKRDARAICWSNYRYYFKLKNNGYSNNFDDLAGYYSLYSDLMDFWHKLYPNKIYDISYEELTANQEQETEKLLKYCDLEWDENCLNFHNNDRPVKTISALQVRKKMYQGSSDAWKQHWAYIQPLISALEKF
jgi:tetratricopeptide (TPR) repeat protein